MKERWFINCSPPKVDSFIIQKHKLSKKIIRKKFIIGFASWILVATLVENSWLNPNVVKKIGILISWDVI